MPAQRETELQNRIRRGLLEEYPGSWLVKIHGGPMQAAGIPDLIGCIEGRAVGLEVKVPGKEDTLTKRQGSTLAALRRAGGISAVVTTPSEALQVVSEGL